MLSTAKAHSFPAHRQSQTTDTSADIVTTGHKEMCCLSGPVQRSLCELFSSWPIRQGGSCGDMIRTLGLLSPEPKQTSKASPHKPSPMLV